MSTRISTVEKSRYKNKPKNSSHSLQSKTDFLGSAVIDGIAVEAVRRKITEGTHHDEAAETGFAEAKSGAKMRDQAPTPSPPDGHEASVIATAVGHRALLLERLARRVAKCY